MSDDLKRRVEIIAGLQGEAEEIKAKLDEEWQRAKEDGYDLKCLRRVVKEARAEPEEVEAQLELELLLDTYRENVGVKTREQHKTRSMVKAFNKKVRSAMADA